MRHIKPNSSVKGTIEGFDKESYYDKEFFHGMQSHFIRNDLQKLIFMLDLVKIGNRQNLDEQIEKMFQICKRADKKMEIIIKIQNLIHSNFTNSKETLSLIEIIKEVEPFFDFFLTIDYDSINYQIKVDGFFKDLIFGLLSFIQNSNGDQINISGKRCSKYPDYYILKISESKNKPFSQDICEKLLTGLKEEEWDYLGNNLEITLASLIANYYGGKLKIHSSDQNGNCYCIYIPNNLLIQNSINQNQLKSD